MILRPASLVGACLITLAMLTLSAGAAPAENRLTLQRAIEAALAGNPELKSFQFRFRASDALRSQAALRPPVEVGLEAENILGSGAYKSVDTAETTLALSHVLELGGKREARIGLADASRGVLEADLRARQLDVLTEVTRRFIDVAEKQERLRLTRLARGLVERTVSESQKRVTAARSPHVELDRANIAQDRAVLDERRAEAELTAARRQLAATWGAQDFLIGGVSYDFVDADLYAVPRIGETEELQARVAANPDFLRYASEKRLRESELRVAATTRRPDVTFSAGVRRFEETGDHAVVASFSVPLFSKRRSAPFADQARANLDLTIAQQEMATLRARATLLELHTLLKHAVNEVETLKGRTLPSMQEALQETEYAYKRGRYSYLELVDAQREYVAIQDSLIDAGTDAHLLQAEIERLTSAPLSPTTDLRSQP